MNKEHICKDMHNDSDVVYEYGAWVIKNTTYLPCEIYDIIYCPYCGEKLEDVQEKGD